MAALEFGLLWAPVWKLMFWAFFCGWTLYLAWLSSAAALVTGTPWAWYGIYHWHTYTPPYFHYPHRNGSHHFSTNSSDADHHDSDTSHHGSGSHRTMASGFQRQDPALEFCTRYHNLTEAGLYDFSGPLLADDGTWHVWEDKARATKPQPLLS